jgi:hypothetical protein
VTDTPSDQWSTAEDTPALRMRETEPGEAAPSRRLQQAVKIRRYQNGKLIGLGYEWRDVPFVGVKPAVDVES